MAYTFDEVSPICQRGAEYEALLSLVGNSGVVGKLYTSFGPTIGGGLVERSTA